MVAPKTTRSSLAQSALPIHIAQGSQVEYIVYPADEGRLSFLRQPDCAQLGVRAGIVFAGHIVRGAHQPLTRLGVYNQCAVGYGWSVSIVRAVNR
jgi:hypothetical protein